MAASSPREPGLLLFRRLATVVLLAVASAPGASKPVATPSGDRDLGIRWIEVPAGTLVVGQGPTACRQAIRGFQMSATEVTFEQYDAYCAATGTPKPDDLGWGRGTRPVMRVSYDDALAFCRWLGRRTGCAIRLPTEAEWEYAAQGGSRGRGYRCSGSDEPNEVSWNERNSGGRTHAVGTKKPNELGFFDMSGNLWEWCADQREDGSRGARPACATCADRGSGPPVYGDSYDNPGSRRGFRACVRVAADSRHENIGFRVARTR
jgi:formylglycine-generating enzyme required for sulfatase activity